MSKVTKRRMLALMLSLVMVITSLGSMPMNVMAGTSFDEVVFDEVVLVSDYSVELEYVPDYGIEQEDEELDTQGEDKDKELEYPVKGYSPNIYNNEMAFAVSGYEITVATWEQLRQAVNEHYETGGVVIYLAGSFTAPAGAAGDAIVILSSSLEIRNASNNMITLTQNNIGQRHFVIGRYASLELSGPITLCGNGANAIGGPIRGGISVSGTLFMDGVTITGNRAVYGGGVHITGAYANADMHNSQIIHNAAVNGGGMAIVSGTSMWDSAYASVDYGSRISHNVATNNGGGVHIAGRYDYLDLVRNSHIIYNTAGGNGGGVNIETRDGYVSVEDGSSISHNTATGDGGGVNIANGGGFQVTEGSRISNNTAGGNGGGVNIIGRFESHSYLGDNSHISNNTATGDGGGINVSGGYDIEVELEESSSISYNTAGGDGGGINFIGVRGAESSIIMFGSYIRNNTAGGDGGGINFISLLSDNGGIDIDYGSSISGNQAEGNGGGINARFGHINLTSGSLIENNRALGDGGGIHFDATGSIDVYENGISMDGYGDTSLIIGNTATNGGGIFISCGFFVLNHASIENNTATGDGGGIFLQGTSYFDMYDGRISGNRAVNGGGIFRSYFSPEYSYFLIRSGTITNNTATGNGGGIFWSDLLMLGYIYINYDGDDGDAHIFNNMAGTTRVNDQLHIEHGRRISSATITAGFNHVFNNRDISTPIVGQALTITPSRPIVAVGRTLQLEAIVNGVAQPARWETFDSGYWLTIDANGVVTGVRTGGPALVMARVGNLVAFTEIYVTTSPGVSSWEELRREINAIPIEGSHGVIYIANSFRAPSGSAGNAITIADRNITLVTSSNEVTLTQPNNGQRHFIIQSGEGRDAHGGRLIMTQGITLAGENTNSGGIQVNRGGWLIMDEGSVIENVRRTVVGGAVAVVGTRDDDATFTMRGGTIRNNSATSGGGVHLGAFSSMSMDGNAMIDGNRATGTAASAGGGGVMISAATSYMSARPTGNAAPTITNNTAASNGGGIRVNAGASLIIGSSHHATHPPVIANNSANNGGGIYVTGAAGREDGTVRIESTRVADNTARGNGGGINIGGSDRYLFVDEVEIIRNTAQNFGGGIHVNAGAYVVMAGSTIANNRVLSTVANNGGGGVSLVGSGSGVSGRATLSMTDSNTRTPTQPIIQNNQAPSGGGVHLGTNAHLVMGSGLIDGNQSISTVATAGGGGVFVATASSRLIMDPMAFGSGNPTISNNSAAASGGGIRLTSGAIVLEESTRFVDGGIVRVGGIISNNRAYGTAANLGGGGIFQAGGTVRMNAGTIDGNTAHQGGGVRVSATAVGAFTATGGAISNNRSNTDGGGIFTTQFSNLLTVPTTGNAAYRNLNISNVTFRGNEAGNGASAQPNNMVPHVRAAELSVWSNPQPPHNPLNNYDINYTARLGVEPGALAVSSWAALRAEIAALPAGGSMTIHIASNFTAPTGSAGNAIAIPTNRHVTLVSHADGLRTILQGVNGQRHFTIASGASLTLSNVTLAGNNTNAGGVQVNAGGTLTMNNNSTIENVRRTVVGGAVALSGSGSAEGNRARLNMNAGSSIAGNSATNGGGIHMGTNSVVNVNGGTITQNTSTSTASGAGGGGVFIGTATSRFYMSSGVISENASNSGTRTNAGGGGIRINNGHLNIGFDVVIENNRSTGTATTAGGGGIFQAGGTILMNGGVIRGNSAAGQGGGVRVSATAVGAFTAFGGTISHNSAGAGGGIFSTQANGRNLVLSHPNAPYMRVIVENNTPNDVVPAVLGFSGVLLETFSYDYLELLAKDYPTQDEMYHDYSEVIELVEIVIEEEIVEYVAYLECQVEEEGCTVESSGYEEIQVENEQNCGASNVIPAALGLYDNLAYVFGYDNLESLTADYTIEDGTHHDYSVEYETLVGTVIEEEIVEYVAYLECQVEEEGCTVESSGYEEIQVENEQNYVIVK